MSSFTSLLRRDSSIERRYPGLLARTQSMESDDGHLLARQNLDAAELEDEMLKLSQGSIDSGMNVFAGMRSFDAASQPPELPTQPSSRQASLTMSSTPPLRSHVSLKRTFSRMSSTASVVPPEPEPPVAPTPPRREKATSAASAVGARGRKPAVRRGRARLSAASAPKVPADTSSAPVPAMQRVPSRTVIRKVPDGRVVVETTDDVRWAFFSKWSPAQERKNFPNELQCELDFLMRSPDLTVEGEACVRFPRMLRVLDMVFLSRGGSPLRSWFVDIRRSKKNTLTFVAADGMRYVFLERLNRQLTLNYRHRARDAKRRVVRVPFEPHERPLNAESDADTSQDASSSLEAEGAAGGEEEAAGGEETKRPRRSRGAGHQGHQGHQGPRRKRRRGVAEAGTVVALGDVDVTTPEGQAALIALVRRAVAEAPSFAEALLREVGSDMNAALSAAVSSPETSPRRRSRRALPEKKRRKG